MATKSPAEMMNNLHFEDQVDTSAAEAYIEKYNQEFRHTKDDNSSKETRYEKRPVQKEQSQILDKLEITAEKIKQNSLLFAQLELKCRSISITDVLSYDIKLIVRRFLSPKKRATDFEYTTNLSFYDGIPLAILGSAADYLYRGDSVIVHGDHKTSACAHLFVKLCHEAGFSEDDVRFAFVDMHISSVTDMGIQRIKNEDYVPGSVFVVTERTDIDSVVASITNATHNFRYPWRIRRVIVQECVYEEFNQILFENAPALDDSYTLKVDLKNVCTNLAKIKGKIFIRDFTGASDLLNMEDPYVFIESYRTTKELLSLLNLKYQPRYLSLWCSDISVANEIGLSGKVENVWMNHFGNFEFTKFLSCYEYTEYEYDFIREYRHETVVDVAQNKLLTNFVNEVKEKRNGWIKMTQKARREKISQLMNNKLKYADINETDDFVHCGANDICYGVKKPFDIVFLDFNLRGEVNFLDEAINPIVEYLVKGTAVIINDRKDPKSLIKSAFDILSQNGVPIAFGSISKQTACNNEAINLYITDSTINIYLTSYKTVWMRYGETFAN